MKTPLERLEAAFPLNPRQREALPHVEWLFSEDPKDRGSGRSTLILYVMFRRLVRESLDVLGSLPDHCVKTGRLRGGWVWDLKERISATDPALAKCFDYLRTFEAVTYKEPVCTHCKKPVTQHNSDGKCLFEASEYHEEEDPHVGEEG